jgi:hypothetical protein
VDDYCFLEFNSKELYLPLSLTFGYLLYDIILIYFKLHDSSEAGKQIYFHHLVGMATFGFQLGFGKGAAINIAVSLYAHY